MTCHDPASAQRRYVAVRTRQLLAIGLVLCVEVALRPQAVDAQVGRPYPDLFGQRESKSTPSQTIDFTMSLSDGYGIGDDHVEADSPQLPTGDGAYSNLDAVVRYTRARGDRRLSVTGSDALRYDPQLQHVLASSYQGSLTFASPLGRREHLSLNQEVAYTPYYQLGLFPAAPVDASQLPQAPSNDYAISKQSAYTYTTGIGFSRDLSLHSSLLLGYELRSSMLDDSARDLLTQGVSLRLMRHATRRASYHVGVASHATRYGSAPTVNRIRTQEAEIGLDYAGQRTGVSLTSGAVVIPGGGRTWMTGSASARFLMSRAWTATLQYNRSLRFVEALPYPFFSNSVSVGLNGQPARRLTLGTSIGYSRGDVGVSAEGGAYGTYTGSAQITVPVTRHYALYSEYLYYHYAFTDRALAGALPPQLGRQTVRFGMKLWLPIFA